MTCMETFIPSMLGLAAVKELLGMPGISNICGHILTDRYEITGKSGNLYLLKPNHYNTASKALRSAFGVKRTTFHGA